MITLDGLTKKFSNGKGLFNIDLYVKKGEVYGYLGPNGAGKSTTIRHLMGYIKPTSGSATINSLNCWRNAAEIQKIVGYLPGEIGFLEGLNGLEFLKLLSGMKNMKSTKVRDALIERFQFDVNTPIRKMSKGMKQKVGIVAAFMNDPEVLILDEPTSGLDPLMQRVFIDLILEEKSRGKTILMSSHQFQEIERTCDRVAIIKDGCIIAQENVHELQKKQKKVFEVTVADEKDIQELKNSGLSISNISGKQVLIEVAGDYNHFLRAIANVNVVALNTRNLELEELFMHFYERKEVM
ncbi:MAG: ABC transporter ATP-binding protein [Bacillota bacterium]|nr:ABC transporter ATP-binding protein [Bacillota bacterium]